MPHVEMIPVTLNGRWPLLLPTHRAAREQWTTGWETERLASMCANTSPGDLLFDIGAEEGEFGALAASWGAQVVCVEPNPRVWPNIRAIFEANNLTDHLQGYWVGFAGDTQRPASVQWTGDHIGYHSDDPWPICAYGEVIGDHGFLVIVERPDCPIITIDALARIHGNPDAITMDVEGAEYRVLRGAENTLRAAHPIVWVSIHSDLDWIAEKFPGEDADAIYAYMTSLGYTSTHLATDHEQHVVFTHPDGRPLNNI